jgi:hypothetical protein
MPESMVESLMGHSQGVKDCYNRFSRDEFAKRYLRAEHLVTIFTPTVESIPTETLQGVSSDQVTKIVTAVISALNGAK